MFSCSKNYRIYYFYVTRTYYTINIKMYRSRTYNTWNKKERVTRNIKRRD